MPVQYCGNEADSSYLHSGLQKLRTRTPGYRIAQPYQISKAMLLQTGSVWSCCPQLIDLMRGFNPTANVHFLSTKRHLRMLLLKQNWYEMDIIK